MIGIHQREERLAELLRMVFPQHRVTASLQKHNHARRTATVRLPEIRILHAGAEGGVLRMKLEFATRDLRGNSSATDEVEQLRDYLATHPEEAIYRFAQTGWERHDGVDCCMVTLEEAYAPPSARRSVLVTDVEELHVFEDGIPAGTSDFGTIAEVAEGERLVVGAYYVGEVLEVSPAVITEHALPQAVAAGARLYRIGEHIVAPEGAESTAVDDGGSLVRNRTLAGDAVAVRVASESRELRIRFPIVSGAQLAAWEAFLSEHADRHALLWSGEDGVLKEAAVVHWQHTARGLGEAGSMELRLRCAEAGL